LKAAKKNDKVINIYASKEKNMSAGKIQIGASEILQFAVKIENNGWEFYKKVVDTSKNEKIRELFILLADEEIKHKEIFEGMLPEIEKYEPQAMYPPEYFAYLRAYADNIIFKKGIEKELPKELNSISVIDFGIRMELDSIAYYHEIKNFVSENQQNVIDRIIEEERKHFLKLSELKRGL
jgi:rubrerythrin